MCSRVPTARFLAAFFATPTSAPFPHGEDACIVQVAILVQPRDNRRNHRVSPLPRLHTLHHQSPQIGFGPHLPAQSFGGVLKEPRFVQKRGRLAGFALKGQLLAPCFHSLISVTPTVGNNEKLQLQNPAKYAVSGRFWRQNAPISHLKSAFLTNFGKSWTTCGSLSEPSRQPIR